ncbi:MULTISPECIES: aminotransferase class IV family protein [Paracoccus]|uniref:aminotransferase class IV family protein n=2 Tax=Paracoccaceae TaxID=31989 RepID=UPI0000555F0F|nr:MULTISPECIES: aminotransferase class IV family protein [Paracoccus]MBB4626490.1 4-amino-4-deoxychorismate lyase [Paracoccus denitrificans]MDK8873003.1 aminotransferase class IV family protein [Paracoccus sp. SSJ]QAR29043.1 aminotransferase class IV [Paracoccus denitrificans]UFS66894.1 aminotransferase class IV family protein [Paracoccus denitrificans]UPV97204.1 aminotransferase class IV family protein [Paracoccus denitrificans]
MESPLCAGSDDPGLRLIETVLWDGARCPRIEGHLARLAAGAQALGWPCDPQAARAALVAPAGQPARLRLTLDRAARIEVTRGPLPQSRPEWRLALAGTRLGSGDPWLRLKTTRRAQYDDARAALPEGIEEAIFLNERGEVCDGTITTVFFDRGQGMRTPPLSCGLLPGVLRAGMLAEGACREELLPAGDLPHVRLWVGNALRGLIPAVWAG